MIVTKRVDMTVTVFHILGVNMSDRYLRVPSKFMGRSVHLWCYGHFGPPVVVFPSAAGFAHEWQQHGMIDMLRPLLNAGRIKLYCPESNVAQAWTRKEGSLEDRMYYHIMETLDKYLGNVIEFENKFDNLSTALFKKLL